MLVPPEDYLQRVREICDRHGVLLILDEVVTALGRIGAAFAHQLYGVEPDIITLGKGLASGYQPLAAMIASRARATASVWSGGTGDAASVPRLRQPYTWEISSRRPG